jgi:LEA14-like dessication related protein
MKRSIHLRKRRKEHAIIITSLSVLILVLLTISPAAAAVSSWDLSPEKPVLGDTLRIKGSASPEEEIEIRVTFEQEAPVSGGEYEYILEGVKIPDGFKNRFTVQASGARDLNVRVKMLIWVTKSSEASGDTATVTQSSVPPGTYQIKMDGDARGGTSTVDLKITAVQQINADSNGDFSYFYNTKAVPPGDFEISVGGVKKKVTLQQGKISGMTPGFSPEVTEPETVEEIEETEDTEVILNPDPTAEAGNKTPASEIEAKEPETDENSGLSLNTLYMLGGMGAAVLILIMYSKRK